MRDLSARLRDIVRRETSSGAPAGRELTYIPDPDPCEPPSGAATCLGGRLLDDRGACIVVERRYEGDRSHGRRRIDACAPNPDWPLHMFDPRLSAAEDWWRKIVFFDIETTGLSGGAGTLAFLVGCGWFDTDGFTVRQFLLVGPSGERPMLEALRDVFADTTLLVTYNGRTFDVPFMETRWAFHRTAAPTDDLAHFDMLPPARRLWSRREMASPDVDGCSLSALERRVLGFHRLHDVPGFEIPARYFQFLRSGNPATVEGVLEHNRHDLVSLAAVMAHAVWLVQEGPEACREPGERVALGRIYERAEHPEAAVRAYEMAVLTGEAEVQRQALSRLAVLHRRHGAFDEAARSWQSILDLVPRSRRTLTPLERRAVEALAIHHEHRVRDLPRARQYAETLGAQASQRERADVDQRLRRLERKLSKNMEPNRLGGLFP
jgi:hypothetical protein